ncbi:phospho-N-acetylmuramoyl-pentapeptide-transferase [Salipaludibacillus agaradhaerens]|jgi:phospho-N-acetylmuramoyl-pentapeptide-transferase|uniref:Phospho-N-acetylmuramoyl-pentapeptide-transferase n=1 Tax=Salipaludibacillus agaradhaerens TaxID=76935 RepID=A0A9Q4FYP1_SALAG|nr:phospho-N-acetylmuramoyl-pentapeptide-transferase [Salipaludibacillus agaradhaerens]UJW58243.1 phospho-N-acetylmuramoyl-pentapeptide-transferase [Bacillus sp. A116_S68]MCR6095943.1 phospho-N-acetylmuramoyl-pentapeptide-transferase [Salipaludibacillus agaradhaerens]MCR6107170.1 phospho-N-acetylmuramoyl-pentapeptide-transferase [Salipaludibacillus agaradhaerens]MCR6114498.1 phospho-N-acetylmuramoyl-pentapeptide-transferase [Salipaludibacillus agaradhaerens]MCR6119200.1 phospho-N-acetylmuramoy
MLEQGLLFTLLLSFLLTVFFSPFFIPFLRRLKFGQSIRDEGPKSHQKKTGTPTMGGLMIILSIVLASVVMASQFQSIDMEIWLLLLVTVGFGLLGFLDDYIKVVKKRNLGLTSKQKFLGQVAIATLVYIVLHQANISTAIHLPGTAWSVDIGWFYFPLIIIMLVGASNAVNLTDGLDGLVAGTSAVAFGAFSIIAFSLDMMTVSLFSVAIVGAVLGFLVFNAHPAKVFMGDTGSLALGGALAMIAILTKMELLLVIIGGVFVIETLSVIIQVISFKSTGKRVFKMSPLHHHYELSGWSEWRVVVTFWIVGILFAVAGVYLEVWMV